MGQIDDRVEDRRRRHQRHRHRGGAGPQGRQQKHDQHHERDQDAHQRKEPAPARHGHDHHRERDRQTDQRPTPFEVVERVAGGALVVDLAHDPNAVAHREFRLTRPGGGLEQGGGARVGPGIDGDLGQHAAPGAGRGGLGRAGEDLTDRRAAAVAQPAGQHVPGLRAHRAAGRVLQRHRNVDALPTGPQQDRADGHRHTDRDQQPDDDPGGQRIDAGRARWQAVRVRVRHPVERRGGFLGAYWR